MSAEVFVGAGSLPERNHFERGRTHSQNLYGLLDVVRQSVSHVRCLASRRLLSREYSHEVFITHYTFPNPNEVSKLTMLVSKSQFLIENHVAFVNNNSIELMKRSRS